MEYRALLETASREAGNCTCMGIDPNFAALPEGVGVEAFFCGIFEELYRRGIKVAAVKPNIGYFSRLDRPLEGSYAGSMALAYIVKNLPARPFILDSKRGDIATSSANYAAEAFDCWKADSVTVSPYMGTDSVGPFALAGKGIYVLNRTSNPGGKDLQNRIMEDGRPVYMHVAELIARWNSESEGTVGAVVGATNLREFEDLSAFYADKKIPMLIPGVGSQGGSAADVIGIMKKTGYPLELCRINSSSALSHPWAKKKQSAPADWKTVCADAVEKFAGECAL